MKILNKIRARTNSCLIQFGAAPVCQGGSPGQGRVRDEQPGCRCDTGKGKSSVTLSTQGFKKLFPAGQNREPFRVKSLWKKKILFKTVNVNYNTPRKIIN